MPNSTASRTAFSAARGVSTGIYAGLNCGPGSGDDPTHVAENRRRASAALGVDAGHLLTLYQVHSPDVVTVREPFTRENAPKADAMVTDRPGIALGVLAADCAPVLFADAAARVIGAAHAGWKGAIAGVTDATLAAMEALGAKRSASSRSWARAFRKRPTKWARSFATRF